MGVQNWWVELGMHHLPEAPKKRVYFGDFNDHRVTGRTCVCPGVAGKGRSAERVEEAKTVNYRGRDANMLRALYST